MIKIETLLKFFLRSCTAAFIFIIDFIFNIFHLDSASIVSDNASI